MTEYAFLAAMFASIAGLLIFTIQVVGNRQTEPHARGFVPGSLVG